MNSIPQIRPYQLEDAGELIRVIDAVCAERQWMYTAHFMPTPAWHHALENPTCPCHLLLVVATAGPTIVGWCDLFPGDAPAEAELGIGLLAPYRNRGWGTGLLQAALTWATQQQLRRIALVVRADNGRAIHLYQKFGFTVTTAVHPPLAIGGEWLEMVLQLRNYLKISVSHLS